MTIMNPRLAQRRADPVGFARSLLFGQRIDERARWSRANSEQFVGLVIGRLPDGWRAVHAVPAGEHGASIDHVVVGPAGTFVINAKDLAGKVWVSARSVRHNGHPTDFLPKAAHGAGRASRLLTAAVGRPVDVRGVVAILADEWTIKEKPTDVHVGSPRGVKDWLLRLPVTLTPREVIEIAAAASTPSTWTTTMRTR
jgi:nuclease-like protein